jgi:hypothetical protein
MHYMDQGDASLNDRVDAYGRPMAAAKQAAFFQSMFLSYVYVTIIIVESILVRTYYTTSVAFVFKLCLGFQPNCD